MTINELKKKLAKKGIAVPAKAKKAELEELLQAPVEEEVELPEGNGQPETEELQEEVAVVEEKPVLPKVDNARVVRVLEGGHTETHFLCAMDNGTTVHVAKRLFERE